MISSGSQNFIEILRGDHGGFVSDGMELHYIQTWKISFSQYLTQIIQIIILDHICFILESKIVTFNLATVT